jgi:hypothetical protein
MAELKTRPTAVSVNGFLASIPDEERRRDARALTALMRKATKASPRMWGPSIVGFGTYRYEYASGRQGDWFIVGFSPRARNLTLYLMTGFPGKAALLTRLGRCKTSRSCLYIRSLADVDVKVLSKLITGAVKAGRARKA